MVAVVNDHGTPTRAEDIDEDDVDLSATNQIGIDILGGYLGR